MSDSPPPASSAVSPAAPPPPSRQSARDAPGALISRLKLRQLALVLAIEETRTLHRAAERLAISQPNATRLLQEIELALSAPLFERRPQGMVATRFGTLVARHARLMFSDLAHLRAGIEGLRDGITGIVRIGAITAALPGLLADAVAVLVAGHPTLSLSVVTDTSDALLGALQGGRLDIMIGRPVGLEHDVGVHVERFAEETLCVVAGRGHRLADRTLSLSLAELAGERWILQPAASPMRRAVEAIFALEQLPLPAHPVEAASVTATVTLLARTGLLAVLPRSVTDFFAGHGAVVELPVTLPPLLAPYALVTQAGRPADPAVSRVLEALRAAARG